MAKAMSETSRRRTLQLAYNAEHNIIPQTIVKETTNALLDQLRGKQPPVAGKVNAGDLARQLEEAEIDLPKLVRKLEHDMKSAAKMMEYERAAELRDQLMAIQQQVEKRRQRRNSPAETGKKKS